MPFINSKISIAVSEDKKKAIKEKLGKAISMIPGKSENWLMVGFEDNYELFFKGTNDEPSAFVEVKIYGGAPKSIYSEMTGVICEILNSEIDIPKDRIYVKYEEVADWGWNGANF